MPGVFRDVDVDFDHDVSPRVWLGYVNDRGLGGRTRYWQYDHQANPVSVVPFYGEDGDLGMSGLTVTFGVAR